MFDDLQANFSGPMLVPSVLLGMVCLYWLFVILGAFDIELFDFDLDLEVDHGTVFDLGLVSLKFLNLGDVPLMIWSSVYSLSFWIAAALTVQQMRDNADANLWWPVLGSALVAVIVTKIVTNPLRGKFNVQPPNPVEELIGRACVIKAETTENHGQAEVRTDAAPLLLNVRTHDGTLAKGESVTIIDFDPETRLYFVSRSEGEV